MTDTKGMDRVTRVPSKTFGRTAAAFAMTALMVAGCADEPPTPVYPSYQSPYYRSGVARPVPQTGGAPEWPRTPQEAPPDLPQAMPESQPWSEPPLSSSPESVPQTQPGTPAASPSGSQPSDPRLDALRKNLLDQGAPAATASGRSTPASAPTGCTNVHQRSGFHDHYGGLNSSGDVLQTCVPPPK